MSRTNHRRNDYELTWQSPGIGRFFKRKLSKARRKYIKMLLIGKRPSKSVSNYESICNEKNN